MCVLAGTVHHGGGFRGPDSPRIGVGFRVGGQVLGLRSRRRTTPLPLELFIRQVCTQFLARDFPQVFPMEVEGVFAGNIPDNRRVGDLSQPLLELHCLTATVPRIFLQLKLHQGAANVLQGTSICQALQTVSPQVQMSQRHRSRTAEGGGGSLAELDKRII